MLNLLLPSTPLEMIKWSTAAEVICERLKEQQLVQETNKNAILGGNHQWKGIIHTLH